VLTLAVGYWLPAFQATGPVVGDVRASYGSVRAKSGSMLARWMSVGTHDRATVGEVIDTGSTGRAALALSGSVSLRLDRDTRVALRDSQHVVIERGAVYVDSGSTPQPDDERLEVVTPAGAVRHVGTQYEVRLVDAGVRIAVREGKVEFSSNTGGMQHASAGEQMTVSRNGAVDRAAIRRDDTSWLWATEAAPHFDIDGRSLAEFLLWAARETGREVVFATAESEAEASRVMLSGSIKGLTPEAALTAVLSTTSLRGEDRDGKLFISGK
jgi:ferric-dicitrate binding protein FerR (iron transport regulator)